MSASLVGSEMCIRDSCSPVLLWMTVMCPAVIWPGDMAHRHFMLTSCAVSYTHLTLPTICSV
eukprot:9377451-Alexandrium_andersonii.AAC.1